VHCNQSTPAGQRLPLLPSWPALSCTPICSFDRIVRGVIENRGQQRLRKIHNEAGLVTPDGMPLVWMMLAWFRSDTPHLRPRSHANLERAVSLPRLSMPCSAAFWPTSSRRGRKVISMSAFQPWCRSMPSRRSARCRCASSPRALKPCRTPKGAGPVRPRRAAAARRNRLPTRAGPGCRGRPQGAAGRDPSGHALSYLGELS
jgi:hypothetical protein